MAERLIVSLFSLNSTHNEISTWRSPIKLFVVGMIICSFSLSNEGSLLTCRVSSRFFFKKTLETKTSIGSLQYVDKISDHIIFNAAIQLNNSRPKTVTVCNRQLLSQGPKLLPKSNTMPNYIESYQKASTPMKPGFIAS